MVLATVISMVIQTDGKPEVLLSELRGQKTLLSVFCIKGAKQ